MNKYLKKHYTSIDIMNIAILLAYAILLIIQMRRYYFENDFSMYFLKTSIIIYTFLIMVCIFKVVYYFKNDILFSTFGIFILALSSYAALVKANYSIMDLLSHWPALLTGVLLTISVYQIQIDKIIKTFFFTIGFLYILRIIIAIAIIFPNIIQTISNHEELDLGFGNHNFPMVLFFFLTLCWVYLTRMRDNRILDATIIALISSLLFLLTRSKTSTLLLALLVVLMTIQSFSHSDFVNNSSKLTTCFCYFKKIAKKCACASPLIVIFTSFAGAISFNFYIYSHPDSLNNLDSLTFVSRFRTMSLDFAYNHIWLPFNFAEVPPYNMYTHTPFSPITGGGLYMEYSDNICHYLICYYGFIIFFIVFGAFLCLTIKAYKQSNSSLLIIYGLISILCIMERSSLLYFANPFLIILFADWSPVSFSKMD